MTLVKFNNGKVNRTPFNEVFDSFFNDSFLHDRYTTKVPSVNIAETDNDFHIELAVPGLKKDEIKINLEKNQLIVSAESKNENVEEGKKYSRKEFNYSSFKRTFNLPEDADFSKINADYVDGILKIDVAKREEARHQSREIKLG